MESLRPKTTKDIRSTILPRRIRLALASSAIFLLTSAGCGTAKESESQPTPEPVPSPATLPQLLQTSTLVPYPTPRPAETNLLATAQEPTPTPILSPTLEPTMASSTSIIEITPTPSIPPVPELSHATTKAPEAIDYLESKVIGGMETYGDESPLTHAQLFKLYEKLNSVNREMKENTYYGTIFVSESTYRNFPENFKTSAEESPRFSDYSKIMDLLEESTKEKGEYFIKQGIKDENYDGRTILFLKGITEPGSEGITSREGNEILVYIDKNGPRALRMPKRDRDNFIEEFQSGRHSIHHFQSAKILSSQDWQIYIQGTYYFDVSEKGFINVFLKNINESNNADNLGWTEFAVNDSTNPVQRHASPKLYDSLKESLNPESSLSPVTSEDYSFQLFLKRHEDAFNKMVHEQPFPDTNKLQLRRLIVINDNAKSPSAYSLQNLIRDSDGGWYFNQPDYPISPDKNAYYSNETGIDRGYLHEMGHSILHVNHLSDMYARTFSTIDGAFSDLESIPPQWKLYTQGTRLDIGRGLMSSVEGKIGLHTNLQLVQRQKQGRVHDYEKNAAEIRGYFPYDIPERNTFSFGKDFTDANIEIFRSKEINGKQSLFSIGTYTNSENGDLTLPKEKLFLPEAEYGERGVARENAVLFIKIIGKDGKNYLRWLDIRDFNIPYWQGYNDHVNMVFDLASEKDDPKTFDWKIQYSLGDTTLLP